MKLSIKLLTLISFTLVAVSSSATVFTYTLQWSGAAFSNTATATATITVDDALLANPGSYLGSFDGGPVTSVDLTVSGASSGNGTFTTSDFSGEVLIFDTGGVTLDLSTELVGQGGWGWETTTGDFNLFSSGSAPTGVNPFELSTDGGWGDTMRLTSFAPVPEPSMVAALMGLSGFIFAVGYRRR